MMARIKTIAEIPNAVGAITSTIPSKSGTREAMVAAPVDNPKDFTEKNIMIAMTIDLIMRNKNGSIISIFVVGFVRFIG